MGAIMCSAACAVNQAMTEQIFIHAIVITFWLRRNIQKCQIKKAFLRFLWLLNIVHLLYHVHMGI